MEIKINRVGSIVRYNGIRLQVIPQVDNCRGCFFRKEKSCHSEEVGACGSPFRADEIIFRKYDLAKKENHHARKKRNIANK